MSTKVYADESVYDAALRRLEFVFARFERVYLSVSFGKDSSVMMQLALRVARRLGKLPLNVLFIDLEGQYRATIEHATELLNEPDVHAWWVCLPMNLRNAVSSYQPFWTCWDPAEREKWIRPMPDHPAVVRDPGFFPFFRPHMEFEEFTIQFGRWFSAGRPTACCVGIRTDESLNRFRTIQARGKTRFDNQRWTTEIAPHLFNAYPLYDWRTEDIWTCVGRDGLKYNRIYDLMHMSGTSIHDARICQPYGDDQRRGLDLFHRCEPETWAKVVARVSGANFGKIYVRSALLGFRKMKCPPGHTWETYTTFLLDSLPRYEAAWYQRRFDHFFWWWEKHHQIRKEDVPQEADPTLEANKKAPSWRRLARCIITNDKLCKSLSFAQTSGQWEKYQALRGEVGE